MRTRSFFQWGCEKCGLEQDEDTKCQTPTAEEQATAELKKDTEYFKGKASSTEEENNLVQKVTTESSERVSKKCITNLDEETAYLSSLKQESVIEISEFVERSIRKNGYIRKHWRGELSLAVSFWINVFLVDLFLKLVEVLSAEFIHSPLTIARATTIYNPFVITILYAWQIIGLWRSCNRHIEATGKRFWARTAQAIVVLGFIATLSNLASSWPLYNGYHWA
ncbi:hypothetical protein ACFL3Q_09530 [Planctomycetota bacterium]